MTNSTYLDSGPVQVVNRNEEIKEAISRIDNMLSDLKVEDCVLFYHGVSMVGKTTLLNKIKEEVSKRGLVTGYIDFDREQTIKGKIVHNLYDGIDGKVNLVRILMDEFCSTGGLIPTNNIETTTSPVEAVDRFLGYSRDLYRFKRRYPFVLFFDTLEDANAENLIWIQEAIVEPFINEFHTLVIFAGRTAPNTRQRDLIHPLERRLAKSESRLFQLRPFTDAQTSKQLENIAPKDRISITVHDLSRQTGGLPGLNDAAIRWLVSDNAIERLLPHLVNEVIFKRMAHKIDEVLKAEILTISPMRLFDSGLISKIFSTFWPDRFGDHSLRQIRQLLNSLQDTRLVEPHPDGYGYAVPYDIRLVISQYWRLAEPKKYYKTQMLSVDWFLDQIISEDYVAVTDLLYHLRYLAIGFERDRNLVIGLMTNETILLEKLNASQLTDIFQSDFFISVIENTLNTMHNKSNRAFDLADQIKRILEKQEFIEAFETNLSLLNKLQNACTSFKERL